MQLEKRGGPGSPPRPPPQEGDDVVVETEVVEVEKSLGAVYGTSIGQFFLGDDLRLELYVGGSVVTLRTVFPQSW